MNNAQKKIRIDPQSATFLTEFDDLVNKHMDLGMNLGIALPILIGTVAGNLYLLANDQRIVNEAILRSCEHAFEQYKKIRNKEKSL